VQVDGATLIVIEEIEDAFEIAETSRLTPEEDHAMEQKSRWVADQKMLLKMKTAAETRAAEESARAEQAAARAEQEAARAEQEAARAEQEAARAEQEAAKSRQLSDALQVAVRTLADLGLSQAEIASRLGITDADCAQRLG
jgi:uncharacterized protein (DUF3084 family)